ncbi:MAG: M48 family metalloprotease, partial [Planctomycetota bacterium]
VQWLDLASAVALTAFAALLLAVAARSSCRAVDPTAHWTEQARQGWPERTWVAAGASMGAAFVAVLLGFTANPASIVDPRYLATASGLLLFYLGRRRVRRVEQRARRLTEIPRLGQGIGWLTSASSGLAIAMALLLPTQLDVAGWSCWLGATLVYVWVGRGGLLQWRLRTDSEPSTKLLEALAPERDAVSDPPPLYQRDGGSVAQAWALLPLQSVLFTNAAVEALTPAQLRGVYRHEIAHLSEGPGARALRTSLLLPLWLLGSWRPLLGLLGLTGYVVCLFFACVWLLVVQRLSRRLEERADAVAQQGSEDPETDTDYALALERLYEVNAVPVVLRGKSHTHPHLYDRLVALGVTPSYERPEPPASRGFAPLGLALVLIGVAILFVRAQPQLWLSREDEVPLQVQAGIKTRVGDVLYDLGRFYVEREDWARAVAFTDWCVDENASVWTLDRLAYALARSGELQRAATVLEQLNQRLSATPALARELPYRARTFDLLLPASQPR